MYKSFSSHYKNRKLIHFSLSNTFRTVKHFVFFHFLPLSFLINAQSRSVISMHCIHSAAGRFYGISLFGNAICDGFEDVYVADFFCGFLILQEVLVRTLGLMNRPLTASSNRNSSAACALTAMDKKISFQYLVEQ